MDRWIWNCLGASGYNAELGWAILWKFISSMGTISLAD
ncbi:hypothetical protein LINPERPRIM_LOCUS28986 [Linum perenne]